MSEHAIFSNNWDGIENGGGWLGSFFIFVSFIFIVNVIFLLIKSWKKPRGKIVIYTSKIGKHWRTWSRDTQQGHFFLVWNFRWCKNGSRVGAVWWDGTRGDAIAALPPMWPGFDSGPVFYVGWVCCWFSPCSEGFSPDSLVFLPPQKTNCLNSGVNFLKLQWATVQTFPVWKTISHTV